MIDNNKFKIICIGAGPAGLTAAYLLAKEKIPVLVLEKHDSLVGGISRTENHNNYLCDIGGHRFFSKSQEIENLWDEILGNNFIERPRKSRIYYNGKFFDYPLKASNALLNLGIGKSILCVLSYIKSYLFPIKNPSNFEQWVSNKFGYRLFSIFFKTYTEKIWGMPCNEISADWAAQRIKGLSLGTAIKNAILPKSKNQKNNNTIIKTLIKNFRYPRKGPGMMWNEAKNKIEKLGGKILMGQTTKKISYENGLWKISTQSETFYAEQIISSIPLPELTKHLPQTPKNIQTAASSLKYRDFLIVGLIIKEENIFDDNWIYIHEPNVKVGRIQNFKSWSPEMVPDNNTNCYGLEYFCFENDNLWSMEDSKLIEFATNELVSLKLAQKDNIINGFVIRQPKAYPIYDKNYKTNVELIKNFLKTKHPTLHTVGRNGMHRYNNQDHSMMTSILTVKNILAEKHLYDPWSVNEDLEYHEETQETLSDKV